MNGLLDNGPPNPDLPESFCEPSLSLISTSCGWFSDPIESSSGKSAGMVEYIHLDPESGPRGSFIFSAKEPFRRVENGESGSGSGQVMAVVGLIDTGEINPAEYLSDPIYSLGYRRFLQYRRVPGGRSLTSVGPVAC